MATAVDVVHEFWRLMATNDFRSVGRVLATDFVVEWPQTRERIRGAEPANGPWRFSINRLIGGETEAVSDVTVSDGVRTDRAISFFTVARGKVTRIVEFWPEPSRPGSNRTQLTEPMD